MLLEAGRSERVLASPVEGDGGVVAAKEAVEEGVTDGVQSGTTSVSDSSPCVEAEVEECAQEQNSGEAASGSSKGAPEDRYSPFECNICFDVAQEPVVTRCGHLYCWGCLFEWMERQGKNTCPVCKGEVSRASVIPLYTRNQQSHAKDRTDAEGEIPERPSSQREEAPPQASNFGGFQPFGNFPGHAGPRFAIGAQFGLFSGGLSWGAGTPQGPLSPSEQRRLQFSRMLMLFALLFLLFLLTF